MTTPAQAMANMFLRAIDMDAATDALMAAPTILTVDESEGYVCAECDPSTVTGWTVATRIVQNPDGSSYPACPEHAAAASEIGTEEV